MKNGTSPALDPTLSWISAREYAIVGLPTYRYGKAIWLVAWRLSLLQVNMNGEIDRNRRPTCGPVCDRKAVGPKRRLWRGREVIAALAERGRSRALHFPNVTKRGQRGQRPRLQSRPDFSPFTTARPKLTRFLVFSMAYR
jgi:hypothetical protein